MRKAQKNFVHSLELCKKREFKRIALLSRSFWPSIRPNSQYISPTAVQIFHVKYTKLFETSVSEIICSAFEVQI